MTEEKIADLSKTFIRNVPDKPRLAIAAFVAHYLMREEGYSLQEAQVYLARRGYGYRLEDLSEYHKRYVAQLRHGISR